MQLRATGAAAFSEPQSQALGPVRRRFLVDGQQRITTFQLVLTAIREVARKLEAELVRCWQFGRGRHSEMAANLLMGKVPNLADYSEWTLKSKAK